MPGLLNTLLHEAPESSEKLLAAPSNGVLTLWSVVGTGGDGVQISAAGVHVLQLQRPPSLKPTQVGPVTHSQRGNLSAFTCTAECRLPGDVAPGGTYQSKSAETAGRR